MITAFFASFIYTGALFEQLIATPFRTSRTISSSSVSTIICPSDNDPLSKYVPEELIVSFPPDTIPAEGSTAIEFPFSET